MDQIRVLIADDHAVVRSGLVALLEAEDSISVVGEAEDGASAVAKAAKLKPDIVVMDLLMPGMDGVAATREIVRKVPSAKVLVLTTSTVPAELRQALEAGAFGAVSKTSDYAVLISAIRSTAAGRRTLSSDIEDILSCETPAVTLTDRQTEVLQLVARGLTGTDIANVLGVSHATVKKHLELIFAKLGVANRTEAAAFAISKQLVKI